jgi:zinc finger SWIM domain-containing protein 3
VRSFVQRDYSFVWLFEFFVKVMYGKHSSAILTDQNATMVATIPHVFPNTTHHLCLWHSDQNVVKHLGFIIKMTEDEADKSGNKF